MGSVGFVNARGPAGQNQTVGLKFGHTASGQVVPDDLAKDILFAHAAGDELHILCAEIKDEHPLLHRASPVAYPVPSSVARRAAASTASINAARTLPRSRVCSPAMVVPPGLATMSLSTPGCDPVSSTILAAPRTVCAASAVATSRGKPTRTPPSLSASIMT